jgi:hypothetical protein
VAVTHAHHDPDGFDHLALAHRTVAVGATH